ncbi:MAG: flagellar biosynthetic protein FliO [Spirochaetes bacterium]|nr:flagellar biosynthetic protein FliO [Spirochaetota bacterium]
MFALLLLFVLGQGPSLLFALEEDPAAAPAVQKTENDDTGVLQEGEAVVNYEYTDPEFAGTETSYAMLILRTVAVLAVIVMAIYLIFRFLLKGRNRIVADTEMIRVLGTFPLAANRLIKIVDIAGKILVLGVTESNINLIMELEDKEIVDRLRLLSSKEGTGATSFKEQFLKLLGGRGGGSKPGEPGYLRGYKDRINRMKKM